jgi:hypothetical protein
MPDVGQPIFYQVYGNVPGVAALLGSEGGRPATDNDHVIHGRDASCSAGGSQQGKNPREEKEWQLAHIAKIV